MTSIAFGALGLLLGLVSHDLAAQALGEKPFRPFGGTCPRCATDRGWVRRACQNCGRSLGREPLVALAGAAGAAAMAVVVGTNWVLIAYLAFVVLSLALALTDIDDMRIVNRLNIPGTAILAVLLTLTSLADGAQTGLGRALAGAAGYFLLTNVMFFAARGRGFGYGDVKLSVQLGMFTAYLSWQTLAWAIFLMALIGGIMAVVVVGIGVAGHRRRENDSAATLREAMRRELPYGPAMIFGSWLAIYLVGIGVLGS